MDSSTPADVPQIALDSFPTIQGPPWRAPEWSEDSPRVPVTSTASRVFLPLLILLVLDPPSCSSSSLSPPFRPFLHPRAVPAPLAPT